MNSDEGIRLTLLLIEMKQKRESQLNEIKKITSEIEIEIDNKNENINQSNSYLPVNQIGSSNEFSNELSNLVSNLPSVDSLHYTPSYFNLSSIVHSPPQNALNYQPNNLNQDGLPTSLTEKFNRIAGYNNNTQVNQMDTNGLVPLSIDYQTIDKQFHATSDSNSPQSDHNEITIHSTGFRRFSSEYDEKAVSEENAFSSVLGEPIQDSLFDPTFLSPKVLPLEKEIEWEEKSFNNAIHQARRLQSRMTSNNLSNSIGDINISNNHTRLPLDDINDNLSLRLVDSPMIKKHQNHCQIKGNENTQFMTTLDLNAPIQSSVTTYIFQTIPPIDDSPLDHAVNSPADVIVINDESKQISSLNHFDYKYYTLANELIDDTIPPSQITGRSPAFLSFNSSYRLNKSNDLFKLDIISKSNTNIDYSTLQSILKPASSKQVMHNPTPTSHCLINGNINSATGKNESNSSFNSNSTHDSDSRNSMLQLASISKSNSNLSIQNISRPSDFDYYLDLLSAGVSVYKITFSNSNPKILLRKIYIQPLMYFIDSKESKLINLNDIRLTNSLRYLSGKNIINSDTQPYLIRWQTEKFKNKSNQFLLINNKTKLKTGINYGSFQFISKNKLSSLFGNNLCLHQNNSSDESFRLTYINDNTYRNDTDKTHFSHQTSNKNRINNKTHFHYNCLTVDNTECNDRTLSLYTKNENIFKILRETIQFLIKQAKW